MAPKSRQTDDIVSYLKQAAKTQPAPVFAETLANLLKEPKLYLIRSLVSNVSHEIILDLVGKTIDIQSCGGMLLSEAGMELKQATQASACVDTAMDKSKKSAGGVLMTLLKKDPRITSATRKKIFKVETERKRQKKFTASLI